MGRKKDNRAGCKGHDLGFLLCDAVQCEHAQIVRGGLSTFSASASMQVLLSSDGQGRQACITSHKSMKGAGAGG